MFELTVRQKIAAFILLFLLIIGGILLFVNENRGYTKEFIDDTNVDRIYVHMCGAVAKPGVISVAPATRKFEALERAGGPLPEADLQRINLAEFVEDGEQIYLPKKGEVIETSAKKKVSTKAVKEPTSKIKPGQTKTTSKLKPQWPLDLNKATREQLETVPGIGPFLAGKIVEQRTKSGGFQRFEELDQVYGIGSGKLEKLKPYLTVK